jgi:phosphoribosylformylglycinamidine synthase PurS subunit
VERTALDLYRFAAAHAESRGIILADTKFELGLDADGALVLADEAFTPDSSRFWPADRYAPGRAQPSFDKQYVRDYCESVGWDKTYPGPELPEEVVAETRAKYIEAFERLTGISFDEYVADPEVGAAMRATVLVRPKEGILDPQGQAVEQSLRKLGFDVAHARVGRVVDVDVDASSTDEARQRVDEMCMQLLANPLIESYEVEVHE